MSSLYLEPEDLINLIAENTEFKEEQIHFHMMYYEGIGKIHKKSEAILALGACALLRNKFQACQEILSGYNPSLFPHLNYLFYFLSGLLHQKMDQTAKALEQFLKAREEEINSIKHPNILLKQLLDCFISSRQFLQAHEYFIDFPEFQESFKTAFCSRLGFCCEVLGMNEKAVFWYRKVSLDGSVAKACLAWADHLDGKDVKDLIEKYREEGSSEDLVVAADWDYMLSLYHLSKDQLDEALEILKNLTESIKKDVYFSSIGYIYFQKKKIIQSFVHYLKALKLNPKVPENWYNLALIYYKVDQNESEKSLERARKIDCGSKFMTSLEPSSEIYMVKTNLSTFGVLPENQNKLKKKRKTAKNKAPEVQPLKVIEPVVLNCPQALQAPQIPHPAFQMPPNFPMFYDSFLRFWNPDVMQRTVPVMPSFNFFANRHLRPSSTQPEVSLPKKRGRK